jgi:hypothetical protein
MARRIAFNRAFCEQDIPGANIGVSAFNVHMFDVVEKAGQEEDHAANVVIASHNLMDSHFAEEAWALLTTEQKVALSEWVHSRVKKELQSAHFTPHFKTVFDPLIERIIDSALETMTPVILEAVQTRLNERWDAAVDKVVNEALAKALHKVKQEVVR